MDYTVVTAAPGCRLLTLGYVLSGLRRPNALALQDREKLDLFQLELLSCHTQFLAGLKEAPSGSVLEIRILKNTARNLSVNLLLARPL